VCYLKNIPEAARISGGSAVSRALRTPEWTYVAPAPGVDFQQKPGSLHYREYQLYNNRGDPNQLVNIAGRINMRVPSKRLIHYIGERSVPEVTEHLRQRLIQRMVEAGEAASTIDYWPYYP